MTSRVTAKQLTGLRADLTDRDWQIIATLARVRVATAVQLEALHFCGVARRRAQRRLAILVRRRVLARLPRVIGGVRAGSRGHVYALDAAGQRLADQDHGQRRWRPGPLGTMFLDHALAVTQRYVDLVLAERAGGLRVLRFVTEPGAWRSFHGAGGARVTLKPDGYAVLGVDGFEDHWFLEVDLATESEAALARKLAVYLGYWRSGTEQAARDIFPKVLWLAPNDDRAGVLRRVISRLPAEAQSLFAVARQDQAVTRLRQGAA